MLIGTPLAAAAVVYVIVLLYKAAKVYVMPTLARRVIAEGAQVGAGYAGIQGSSV